MRFLFSLLTMLAISGVVIAQEDNATLFDLHSLSPVVPRQNYSFTDPGAVLFHDGTYYMFHNGFSQWPGRVNIHLSTSSDGLLWEMVMPQPVWDASNVDYAGVTLLASSALVEDDGTWVLYFYTWETDDQIAPTSIGRATADSPEGPWTADPEPVLVAGDEDGWDSLQVAAPDVIRLSDGTYVMYYTGMDGVTMRIGMATSDDGITWEKYDDPATTDAPYADSDPIIAAMDNPDIADDRQEVWQPRVVMSPDGYVMIFKNGRNFYDNSAQVNLALSEDGRNWAIQFGEHPVDRRMIERGNAVWFTDLLYNDDTYFIYAELGRFDQYAGNTTEVYAATYSGNLTDAIASD